MSISSGFSSLALNSAIISKTISSYGEYSNQKHQPDDKFRLADILCKYFKKGNENSCPPVSLWAVYGPVFRVYFVAGAGHVQIRLHDWVCVLIRESLMQRWPKVLFDSLD